MFRDFESFFRFRFRMGRKKCPHVETMEKSVCKEEGKRCEAAEALREAEDAISPECAVTQWSEWSPCSVSCGELRAKDLFWRQFDIWG